MDLQAVQMAQRPALGVFGIGQERSGGGVGLRHVLRVPGLQAGGFEVLLQFALAQGGIKLPVGPDA